MSRSPHSLKIYSPRTGTTYTVSLYNTKEEANNYNACFPLHIDNQTLYAAYDGYLGEFPSGGATPLRVQKNGVVFQVVQHGFHYLQIQQSANQTIACTANGQSWIDESVHFFPYGTQWHATIVGHDGYNPGALNVSSGTLTNSDVTITATAATLAIPTGNITFPPDRRRHNWVCPPYITRIKCSTQQEEDKYYSVIPGATYQFQVIIMGPDNNAWFMIKNNKSKQVTNDGYYYLMVSWGPDINNHT